MLLRIPEDTRQMLKDYEKNFLLQSSAAKDELKGTDDAPPTNRFANEMEYIAFIIQLCIRRILTVESPDWFRMSSFCLLSILTIWFRAYPVE